MYFDLHSAYYHFVEVAKHTHSILTIASIINATINNTFT